MGSESDWYNAFCKMRTNHLGDSGMKNNPGINTVQGKIPAME